MRGPCAGEAPAGGFGAQGTFGDIYESLKISSVHAA
jgi:hypothetical protein